ncbi:hypothetical protein CC2G_000117 [Coprinopsis cinerea AmutBmut pab1-1]|nr:hypothetical protein CC2G_000117 [Coprinopsis cinerea AmutBmut pab1-1]
MTLIANNRFFRRKWDLDLFNSTILSDVWPDILFFTAFSTAVTLVHQLTPHKLGIDTQLLVVAGVVLGLVISFRTSSAYERYRDGAKMWSNIRTGSRILAQLIWIHVPDEREADEDGHAPSPMEVIMEKRTMINLIHAFAVSVKHLLRGEPGVFYEDLYPSVAHLPRYAADKPHPNDILPLWHIHGGRKMTPAAAKRKDTLMAQVSTDIPELKPARMPPDTTIYDYFGILRLGRFIGRRLARKTGLKPDPPPKRPKKRIAYSEVVESTVPLELHLILSNYTACRSRSASTSLN